MQNTVLFLWRSLSKFHPTSLLSKQQHPWFRDWLRIISPIPVTLWGLEPRSWCMQLLGGLGLWSVRWLRMQVMITGKFLSKVFWMWTARVRDDLEEKVVQGSSFDYLTENWRIKQTKEINTGINVWMERGVAFYGQIPDLTDSWLTFKFWKTPVHVLGIPQPGVPQVHSQNIWDERIPIVFSFKWNLFGTTAINTNFSAPTHRGSWTLHQSFSV